jgi:hypothetical protein
MGIESQVVAWGNGENCCVNLNILNSLRQRLVTVAELRAFPENGREWR